MVLNLWSYGDRMPHGDWYYLHDPSIWCTKVAQRVVPNSGDQDSCEQDIIHLPIEEVQSVVRLWHQSGFGDTVAIFRVLHKQEKHIQNKGAKFWIQTGNSQPLIHWKYETSIKAITRVWERWTVNLKSAI